MTRPGKIAILGSRGHALAVLDACLSAGFNPTAFIDPRSQTSRVGDVRVLPDLTGLDLNEVELALGVGANFDRQDAYERVKLDYPLAKFPPIIHRKAWVSPSAVIGPSSVVLSMASVGPHSVVECGVLLNTGSSLDHNSIANEFSSLAPGARTGGDCVIGARSSIGMGASVLHGVTVGADVVVGAQSLVLHTLDNFAVAYGVPATQKRKRTRHEAYL